MSCIEIRELIPLYVDKELDSTTQQKIEQHIKVCTDCQQEMAFYQMINEELSVPDIAPPAGFHQQLMERINRLTKTKNQTVGLEQELDSTNQELVSTEQEVNATEQEPTLTEQTGQKQTTIELVSTAQNLSSTKRRFGKFSRANKYLGMVAMLAIVIMLGAIGKQVLQPALKNAAPESPVSGQVMMSAVDSDADLATGEAIADDFKAEIKHSPMQDQAETIERATEAVETNEMVKADTKGAPVEEAKAEEAAAETNEMAKADTKDASVEEAKAEETATETNEMAKADTKDASVEEAKAEEAATAANGETKPEAAMLTVNPQSVQEEQQTAESDAVEADQVAPVTQAGPSENADSSNSMFIYGLLIGALLLIGGLIGYRLKNKKY